MATPKKIQHKGQVYVLASKTGPCPFCKKDMEIGDEMPEERICDVCAKLPPEKLKKMNPKQFAVMNKKASARPEKVKFHGALYVKADPVPAPSQPHEKCPAGKHWNAKKKQCMKVPANLHKAIRHANGMSKSATNPGYKPEYQKKVHHQAAKAHNIASNLAARHGFHSLAVKHKKKQFDHQNKAK